MDCIFCKIVQGSIPSAKVYEDDQFISILDINPVSKGHLLVIPKKHYENIFDADEENLKKAIVLIKKLSIALTKALNVRAVNLIQNNGADAGQIIFHSHFHIIPRSDGDGIEIGMIHKKYEEGELNRFAELIREKI